MSRLSKRLSFLLRHRPDAAGLVLDEAGWAPVPDVLRALRLDRAGLEQLVRDDGKQRFALVGERLRAQQGHSVDVDLGLAARQPPDVLWHGTAAGHLDGILRDGLLPGRRTHVHLSPDPQTARTVGARHGAPVVLRVDAARAHADGHAFLLSGNGVWLTDAVSARYLST